jgi:ATP-binding cassette, subfamily G (WHITE), member 2, PDR
MAPFLETAPGHLNNPDATTGCEYCTLSVADQFLAGSNISWDDRWRNYGIMWGYIVFSIAIAVLTYYLFRVRSWKKKPEPLSSKEESGAQKVIQNATLDVHPDDKEKI